MRSVGASHIGKVRTENQDKIFFHDQPVGNLKNLYIVADGMGGRLRNPFRSRRPWNRRSSASPCWP